MSTRHTTRDTADVGAETVTWVAGFGLFTFIFAPLALGGLLAFVVLPVALLALPVLLLALLVALPVLAVRRFARSVRQLDSRHHAGHHARRISVQRS
jgi:membrane protein implicated in regulation of membrane protease activity